MLRQEIIEILVEEKSMEVFLEGILPTLLPEGFVLNENCFIRPHNGKQELQKKLPLVARAYKHYSKPVIVIVLHDQDSADCIQLKNKLVLLIKDNNDQVRYLVRIVCRELENWYLGDLYALEKAYPETKASRLINKAKYRNPDLTYGSHEIKHLTKDFAKTDCARVISKFMFVEKNTSKSFQVFINGLNEILVKS